MMFDKGKWEVDGERSRREATRTKGGGERGRGSRWRRWKRKGVRSEQKRE